MTMADLTYKQLQSAVTDLKKNVTRASQAIQARAQTIDDEAKDTARVADMIASMQVDTATVSETGDLSRILRGVSDAAITYAAAGDNTARAAQTAHQQAHTTHDGINEAVNRAPVDNIHRVHREWLRQE
jgi:hypothetical protein